MEIASLAVEIGETVFKNRGEKVTCRAAMVSGYDTMTIGIYVSCSVFFFFTIYLIKWEFLNIKINYLGRQLHLPQKNINLMLNLYIIFYRSTKLYIYIYIYAQRYLQDWTTFILYLQSK
jgi:hypothetical protein